MTSLSITTNQKGNNHNFIFILINWLINIVYYKLVKITVNISKLAKVIINVIIWPHSLSHLIVTNKSLFLYQNSDLFYITCLASRNNFSPLFIFQLIVYKAIKQYNIDITLSFSKFQTKQLGKTPTNGHVCLQ